MIYYRVAHTNEITEQGDGGEQTHETLDWRWCSGVFVTTSSLRNFLKSQDAYSVERMLVFFCSQKPLLNDLLERHNKHQVVSAITAGQFMAGKEILPIEIKRLELEQNTDTQHDQPYVFTLPTNVQEMRTWTRLMTRVQRKELVS